MPAAGYVRASVDGGQMKGGAPRVVWLTLGADPQQISAPSAAHRLRQLGRPPHLVWNPVVGEVVQLIPIVRAACSLSAACDMDAERPIADLYTVDPLALEPADGRGKVHTEGRLCVQVGVIGFGWAPFTGGPMNGLGTIMEWLDSWGIPRRWPAGRPAPFAHAHTVRRSRKLWAAGGHFGASQVPCCSAAGPGAIDIEMMNGAVTPSVADVPLPRAGGAPQRPRPAPVSRMDTVLTQDEAPGALARVG
jgi:hypothetical protein